jgi:hypothetical protein
LFCRDIIDPQTKAFGRVSSRHSEGRSHDSYSRSNRRGNYSRDCRFLCTSVLEFVVANAPLLKQYAVTAFQSGQLGEVIDAIKHDSVAFRSGQFERVS